MYRGELLCKTTQQPTNNRIDNDGASFGANIEADCGLFCLLLFVIALGPMAWTALDFAHRCVIGTLLAAGRSLTSSS
jgi:hypothetical protein